MSSLTPVDRFVDAGPVRLHYAEWPGDGPPVVLVHGTGRTGRSWDAVARALTGAHRVLALDARGHGLSEATESGYGEQHRTSDLAAFVEATGLERAHFVGHSLGGATVALFAIVQPERVGATVLIEPVVDAHFHWRNVATPERLQRQRRHWPDRETLIGRLRENFMTKNWDDAVLDDVIAHEFEHGLDGSLTMRLSEHSYNDTELLADRFDLIVSGSELRAPTLVLGAANSRTDEAGWQRLATAFHSGTLRMVPGVGHAMYMEQPATIAKITREYLAVHPLENAP